MISAQEYVKSVLQDTFPDVSNLIFDYAMKMPPIKQSDLWEAYFNYLIKNKYCTPAVLQNTESILRISKHSKRCFVPAMMRYVQLILHATLGDSLTVEKIATDPIQPGLNIPIIGYLDLGISELNAIGDLLASIETPEDLQIASMIIDNGDEYCERR